MKRQRDPSLGDSSEAGGSTGPLAAVPAAETSVIPVTASTDSLPAPAPVGKDVANSSMLHTVEDVLAVLPEATAPTDVVAQPPTAPAGESTSSFLSAQYERATKSGPFSAEPPSLDLSTAAGIIESPALMPATAHAMMATEVEQLPTLSGLSSRRAPARPRGDTKGRQKRKRAREGSSVRIFVCACSDVVKAATRSCRVRFSLVLFLASPRLQPLLSRLHTTLSRVVRPFAAKTSSHWGSRRARTSSRSARALSWSRWRAQPPSRRRRKRRRSPTSRAAF